MTGKQIRKLIITLIISALVGGAIGYRIELNPNIISNLREMILGSADYIVYLASIVIIPLFLFIIFLKRKVKSEKYDDSETSAYEKYQKHLTIATTLSSIFIMLSAMTMTNLQNNVAGFLVFVNVFVGVTNECMVINLIQKVQPEKTTDAMDFSFNHKYIDTLDEMEFKKSGKSALQTLASLPIIAMGLFLAGVWLGLSYEFFLGIFSITTIFMVLNLIFSLKNNNRTF